MLFRAFDGGMTGGRCRPRTPFPGILAELFPCIAVLSEPFCTKTNLAVCLPYSIMTEKGFVKAASDNLPFLDSIMVADYMRRSDNYRSAEFRGVKTTRASRESYGDTAIGYVQLKRENNICTVKAKICPEHRVSSKAYGVSLSINEENNNVISVQCHDCAASSGGCKHAIAFLMWVHRRSEDPSPTSTECYWRKSVLSRVGSTVKFVKAKNMGITNPGLLFTTDGSFLQAVLQAGKENGANSQLLKHFDSLPDVQQLSMHFLIQEYKGTNQDPNADDFLEFCETMMTIDKCKAAVQDTQKQSNSTMWHELRYARITASKIYEVSRSYTFDGTLADIILGAAKLKQSLAMERGSVLEEEVIKELEKKYGKLGREGIILNSSLPVIGASPDAVSNSFVVEVKCPSTVKAVTRYVKDDRIMPKFYAQIQLQMHLAKKKQGLFAIASPAFETDHQIQEIWVTYDEKYCKDIVDKAMIFWKLAIFPKLIS